MGNETFYEHGLIGISGLNLQCLTHHIIHETYQIYPMIAISSLLLIVSHRIIERMIRQLLEYLQCVILICS